MANLTEELQQQSKKDLVKKFAIAQSRPTCRQCWKYTDRKGGLQCYGHDSGDVADRSKDSDIPSAKSPASEDAGSKTAAHTLGAEVSDAAILGDLSPSDQLAFLNGTTFDRGVIAELLEKHLLVVTNAKDKGMLIIKLQYNPAQLSVEQQREFKKFVNAILNELDIFKNANNIKADCCKIDRINDQIRGLTISLPTAALYDAFIQQLANNNLLPVNVLQPQNAKQNRNNPFSTQLSPATQKQLAEEELHINKRPSSIKSPLNTNGPKPKGFA